VIRMSTSTTIGAANDKVPAKIEGNRVEIGFNNRFLLDAFRACDLDTIKVTLNGPLSPITVVPVEGDSFLFLVLPVRLRNEK
ncbi:MAG: DNA polymerase III subunit beta, partial [Clostridiales bacterium]|nr:DNA polymerase III subunit beta [Clostridiales bacterium]